MRSSENGPNSICHALPHLELPRPVREKYSGVLETVESLDPHELIEYWSSFKPSDEIPFPSVVAREEDDLAAVLGASKPAAILRCQTPETPLMTSLLEMTAIHNDLVSKVVESRPGKGEAVRVVGMPRSVELIHEQLTSMGEADERYHRIIGSCLGIPAELVENYILKLRAEAARVPRVPRQTTIFFRER